MYLIALKYFTPSSLTGLHFKTKIKIGMFCCDHTRSSLDCTCFCFMFYFYLFIILLYSHNRWVMHILLSTTQKIKLWIWYVYLYNRYIRENLQSNFLFIAFPFSYSVINIAWWVPAQWMIAGDTVLLFGIELWFRGPWLDGAMFIMQLCQKRTI